MAHRGTTALLMTIFALAGCAPTFVRAETPVTTVDRDLYECRREAEQITTLPTGPYGGLILITAQLQYLTRQREVVTQCMAVRGYEKR